ncbi:Bacterial type II secretion system protein F domain protein [Rosistilla ulvae]|uniref:Bacterial type II secretion system protein F domain protein n=1 Tax=Rosistilla ulvae TaxID=1930277 RepID=A0A517LTD4_9BACT|nr:type II secretion system F family protein [Rosistilla ulvae]QDS85894.1 Bacterial type II secretion system protein F domain protein [Rosistilla ulvae]
MLTVFTIFAFISVSLFVYCLALPFCGHDSAIDRRCESLTRKSETISTESGEGGSIFRESSADRNAKRQQPLRSRLAGLLAARPDDWKRLQKLLSHAGFYRHSHLVRCIAMTYALAAAPPIALLAMAFTGGVGYGTALAAGALFGFVGLLMPQAWLGRRVRQRHVAFCKGLPDFLDLTSVCLRGGLSLHATLPQVHRELQQAHPVMGDELSIVQSEMALGSSPEAALQQFATRTGYEPLRTLSTFVTQSQKIGTELCESIKVLSETLREQREMDAEESAQKAGVKVLLPTMLLILPATFVVLAGPAAIEVCRAFSK